MLSESLYNATTIKLFMKTLTKHITLAIVAFVLLSAIIAGLSGSSERPEEITLSQLVSQLNAYQVSKITIREQDLEIKLKDEAGGKTQTAKKEADASLSEVLLTLGASPNALRPESVTIEVSDPGTGVMLGRMILPILAPVLFFIFLIWFMGRKVQQANGQAMNFGQSRARLIGAESSTRRVTFKDVAGADEAKAELMEIVDFLKEPKKYLDIGARIPRGVLMMGSPGTGKTLLARAVAGEANVPFFQIAASEFVEMFVGVGASRVRDLFKQAKKAAPAIIFIDEVDAVGRHRGAGLGGGHDEREQTLNQILVEMDGFDTSDQVIVMAATNRPDVLDPALLRPGRFDRRVVIDLPDLNAREAILKLHSKKKPMASDVNLRRIGERTPGLSGADLANLVNEAAITATRMGKKEIKQDDLLNAIEKVLLGPERKSHILTQEEKKVTAFHEAGHALVAASLPHADPVHKVSIVSRGRAAGYTLKIPEHDRHLHSRSHFLDDLAVSLGGYAAEDLVFGELTTGSSDDIKRASDLARALVMKYGMSAKVGPVAFGHDHNAIFLGKELTTERNYSERVADVIDEEVSGFMKNAFKRAKSILIAKRHKLEEIANYLIEHESIEKEEFDRIMSGTGGKRAPAAA